MPSNETLLKRNVVLNGSARENETIEEVVEEEQPSRKEFVASTLSQASAGFFIIMHLATFSVI